jgi:hypothetical protein
VLIHFLAPYGKLYQRLPALEQVPGSIPPIISAQQHPGPRDPQHGIPSEEWPNVVRRVRENHEPLRQVAADYGVSRDSQAYSAYFSQEKSRLSLFHSPCLSLRALERDAIYHGVTLLITCSRIAPVHVARQVLQPSQYVSGLPLAHLPWHVPHAMSANAGT